jgi:8-oxo-dGTP pyrophosphatase MutT (NUDIX family)
MAIDVEEVLKNCRKNLEKGRAIATGIGVFALVVKEGKFFLRVRLEKGSIYNKDLSGNWELPGGGVEIGDFGDDPTNYTRAIFNALKRELMEEGGLELVKLDSPLLMLPAWLLKDNIIDLAFVVLIPWGSVQEMSGFHERLSQGLIEFFDKKEISALNVVSPRMKFLINKGISWEEVE